MALDDSMPGHPELPPRFIGEPDAESIPLITPAEHEPVAVLVLGLSLFIGLLILAWMRPAASNAGSSFTVNLDARQQTYFVELLLYHSLQHNLPAWLNTQQSVTKTSAETAALWAQVSHAGGPQRRIQAFAAVDAAALYGVARQWPAARDHLQQAAKLDPAHPDTYQQLQMLYAETPHAVTLSADTEAVLAQLSAGPLIHARNAALRGDRAGEIAALRFGASAGQRVVMVGLFGELLLVALLLIAAVVFFTRANRVAEEVNETEHQQAPGVPWGIGAALIAISLTYLLSGIIAPLLADVLRIHAGSAQLVLQVLATLFSAIIVLGLFLLLLGHKPWEWEYFGWRSPSRHRGAGYGILLLLMSLPFVLGLTYLSERLFGAHDSVNPLIPELLTARTPLLMIFLVLAAVIMAPLVEETLFRGLLFRAANARMPFWVAAIGTGLLFGAVHGELVALLPISLLGAVFAFLTRRTGSLLASATAHAGFNAFESLMLLLTAWALNGPGT